MKLAALFAVAACAPAVQSPANADLEARVKRLEATNAKYAEALEFLGKVYDQQKAQTASEDAREPADDAVFAVDIAADVAAGQVDGPATAAVTIVKAFDFACPYCHQVAPILDELVKQYAGKLRVVYKNMVVHPAVATPAHLASCAAAKQGKYLAFKTAVWEKGFVPYSNEHDAGRLAEPAILAIASGVGLDPARVKADMASDECKARIAADMKDLESFHVDATPTFFINGTEVSGALPKEGFEAIIEEKLAAVAKSGIPAGDYYARVVMKGETKFRSKTQPKR